MNATDFRYVPFKQVDVFTDVPFMGNPVAVVLDGNGLSTAQMQAVAAWTNLSETTFVCEPVQAGADYRLRIFTPKSEIPFAGHPTLGSAWALLQSGLKPKTAGRLMQECGKGLVAVRIVGESLFFELPEPGFASPGEAHLAKVAAALGVTADEIVLGSIIDVGPIWLTLQLRSAEEVTALKPDMALLAALGNGLWTGISVFGTYEARSAPAIEVRSFAPGVGVPEDPVCGSGNGCVAALIRRHKVLDVSSYIASQGRRLGRDGHVKIEFAADGAIWVGGNVVTCVDGVIWV